jgi:hypothetical protein
LEFVPCHILGPTSGEAAGGTNGSTKLGTAAHDHGPERSIAQKGTNRSGMS